MPAGGREDDTVEIIVQLVPEATLPTSSGGTAVRQTAADDGVVVEPLHPGTDDAELATWARVRVPSGKADRLVTRLAACPGVAAAYVRP